MKTMEEKRREMVWMGIEIVLIEKRKRWSDPIGVYGR